MTRLEWTNPAVADLENIHDYLSRDSSNYADTVIERILQTAERLEAFPESGRSVPEAVSLKVREIVVGSYRIIYRVRRDLVQILAVVHGARDISGMKPKPWELA